MAIRKTTWRPDTCDCVIEFSHDDSVPPEEYVFTGEQVFNACEDHSEDLKPHEHFLSVLEENTTKNKALELLRVNAPDELLKETTVSDGSKLDVFIKEPTWSFDAERTLVIEHPDLQSVDKETLSAELDKQLGEGLVTIV